MSDSQLIVTLKDVRDACELVRSVPMPLCETSEVRNEAVMDVYTLLEQLAMERACMSGGADDGR